MTTKLHEFQVRESFLLESLHDSLPVTTPPRIPLVPQVHQPSSADNAYNGALGMQQHQQQRHQSSSSRLHGGHTATSVSSHGLSANAGNTLPAPESPRPRGSLDETGKNLVSGKNM